jgi:hypothetical protein
MGLDQYANAIDNNGEMEELAYWRKHPNLQGFMEDLWNKKGCPGKPEDPNSLGMSDFNCVPVELEYEDLDSLEEAINSKNLPETTGFFFGSDSDEFYKEQDLEFIRKAREALDAGLRVEYSSWW